MVHFRLRNADVEQDNVKGERRYFIPRVSETKWDTAGDFIVIPFEYRPLYSQEISIYGTRNQQDKIITETMPEIYNLLNGNVRAMAALEGEHRRNDNDSASHLEHHLHQYVRRNNSDFFIHKDLSSFLNRELDFYLKNEVLNLENIVTAGQDIAEGWFQQLRLTKDVGRQIIDFLAQIESFQKALWEKRKFITDTQYCVRVGIIDEIFYPEIVKCDAQWDEWDDQLSIDLCVTSPPNGGTHLQNRRSNFLDANPTLVVDTRHFEQDFVDRLIASFENLDAITDGFIVKSDNWQALNLLSNCFHEQVNCVYIDPPYNTAASEITYKNGYKHSSWLSLMADRFRAAVSLLGETAAWVVAIDDTEMAELSCMLEGAFPTFDRNVVIVRHHPAGAGLEGTNVSSTHEYALFLTPVGAKVLRGKKKDDGVEEIGFIRTGTANSNLRIGRPNSFYAILVDPENSEIVGVEPPPPLGQKYPKGMTSAGHLRIYPVGLDETERVWRRSYKTVQACIESGEVICKNGRSIYLVKEQTGKRRPVFSTWMDKKYNAGTFGSNLLKDIFGDSGMFSYPKSIFTVRDCVDACIHETRNPLVLDYFAGSGTTGHAIINLNREDSEQRQFILVEMGDHFDTVLIPRIKKVTFSPEWKDGKPQRLATEKEAEHSPRIVKYIRLESYEDALDSIEFELTSDQMELTDTSTEYFLKYMLKWETKGSETLLNVAKLVSPFSYRLRVHVNGEKQVRAVDVAETFNFLLGLKVEERKVYADSGRRYLVYRGETRDRPGHKVAVVWRESEGWNETNFERDRDFVAQNNLSGNADSVYVNGDSAIPGAKPIEPVFKDRMFARVNN